MFSCQLLAVRAAVIALRLSNLASIVCYMEKIAKDALDDNGFHVRMTGTYIEASNVHCRMGPLAQENS